MNNVFDELFEDKDIYTRYKFIREVYNFLRIYHMYKKHKFYNAVYNVNEFLIDVKYTINNRVELTPWQRNFIIKLMYKYNHNVEKKYYNALALAC